MAPPIVKALLGIFQRKPPAELLDAESPLVIPLQAVIGGIFVGAACGADLQLSRCPLQS